jgi:hypothetical protein
MAYETQQERGARMLREGGYTAPDDAASIKTQQLRRGGNVMGAKPASRPDRKGKAAVKININTSDPAREKSAAKAGLVAGAKLGAMSKMPGLMPGAGAGAPPMDGPQGNAPPMDAAGGMPPGGAPMPMQPPMKRGGLIKRRAAGGAVDDDRARRSDDYIEDGADRGYKAKRLAGAADEYDSLPVVVMKNGRPDPGATGTMNSKNWTDGMLEDSERRQTVTKRESARGRAGVLNRASGGSINDAGASPEMKPPGGIHIAGMTKVREHTRRKAGGKIAC